MEVMDIIYTTRPTDYASFIAADLGFLNGCISSDKRILQREKYEWAFKIEFIDNDFKNYNHKLHLDVVKEIRPKYATVRDVMTKKQCAKEGIEFYELEQILDWANELNEYAENAIVIPKYDCLNNIDKEFTLGYSVLTKYGGTPLDISLFSDWNVHLLGGNPRKQIEIANNNSNVVSFDNNYIEFIAQKGRFVTPELKERKAESVLNFDIQKHRLFCLFLSFNSIAARFNNQQENNKKLYIPKNQFFMESLIVMPLSSA